MKLFTQIDEFETSFSSKYGSNLQWFSIGQTSFFVQMYCRGMTVRYRSNFHNPHLKISAKKRVFSAYTRTDRT